MGKRDLRINYANLDEIESQLGTFQQALDTLENAVITMEKNLIENNSGKAVDKLEAQCNAIKKQLIPHREQVKDLKDLMSNYITEMTGLINPNNRNQETRVSRNDVWANMRSIDSRAFEFAESTYSHTQKIVSKVWFPEDYTETAKTAYRQNEKKIENLEIDIIKPFRDTVYEDIENLWGLYNRHIKAYENKDDEYRSKVVIELYDKYVSNKEMTKDLGSSIWKAVDGFAENFNIKVGDFLEGTIKLVLSLAFTAFLPVEWVPNWAKKTIKETTEGMVTTIKDPYSLLETTAQNTSDSVEQNGWAYAIGGVAPDILAIYYTKRVLEVKSGKSGGSKGTSGTVDVIELTRAQQRNLNKLKNIVENNLTEGDFSGTLADLQGNPIPKPGGGYWDHLTEMKQSYKGLQDVKRGLEGSLQNPSLSESIRNTLQSNLDIANSQLNRIEELFKPYGGIK